MTTMENYMLENFELWNETENILLSAAPSIVDPISWEMLLILSKVAFCVATVVSLTGVFTNVTNLRTFLRMGLEDNATISFFALSMSDLAVCIVGAIGIVPMVFEFIEREGSLTLYISPIIPSLFIECIRRMFTCTTVLITTYIALQRCLCVLVPFKVKWIFTKRKTFCYLFIVSTISPICYALYLRTFQMIEYDFGNFTKLIFYIPPGSDSFSFFTDIFLAIILNSGCQVIVIVCLIIMFVTLRKSAEFRKSAMSGNVAANGNPENEKGKTGGAETTKETQALRQVAIISTIFVLSNTPYLINGAAHILIPEFGVHKQLHNTFYIGNFLLAIIETFNSTVNFFVYFKFNSKFRKHCPIFSKSAS